MHVVTGLERAGAERMLASIVERGAEAGWVSAVVSLTGPGPVSARLRSAGADVTELDLRRGSKWAAGLFSLAKVARRHQPDVIHGWMYHGNLAALAAAKAVGRQDSLVWGIRQSMYGLRHEKPGTRLAIRSCARLSHLPRRILYNSERAAIQHEKIGFCAMRAQVIPNGIDVRTFACSQDVRDRLRHKLRLPRSTVLVGNVARHHPMKDHTGFLNAARMLLECRPHVHFVLAGKNVKSGIVGDLAAVEWTRWSDNLHVLGEIEDVSALIPGLDILCVSSAWGEGFPTVLAEAMASGVLCVTTDVGDAAQVVGATGRVVHPGDPGAMSTAIVELVDLAGEERAHLVSEARHRIETEYSLDVVFRRYREVYEQLSRQMVSL